MPTKPFFATLFEKGGLVMLHHRDEGVALELAKSVCRQVVYVDSDINSSLVVEFGSICCKI